MSQTRFEANSVEEAIAKGLSALGKDRDQVQVQVIQEARKGFLGLGARPAIVELSRLAQKPQEKAEPLAAESPEEKAPAEEKPKAELEEKAGQAETEDQPWALEDVGSYIIDVMKAYLVDVTVDIKEEKGKILFTIHTDKPGLVIGKHGKIINSLETLAKTLVHRHIQKRADVELNVGDYRQRRERTLEKLAERTADEVTVSQETVHLDPLPANERKIIHQTLSKYGHIRTHSEGKEPYRHLVVSYKD